MNGDVLLICGNEVAWVMTNTFTKDGEKEVMKSIEVYRFGEDGSVEIRIPDRVAHGHDSGVRQRGEELGLAVDPGRLSLAANRQQLDGDPPVVGIPFPNRQVDLPHTSAAQAFLQFVGFQSRRRSRMA